MEHPFSQEIRAPPGFELRKLSNMTNTSECLGSLVGRYLQQTWVVYHNIYIYIYKSFFFQNNYDNILPKSRLESKPSPQCLERLKVQAS